MIIAADCKVLQSQDILLDNWNLLLLQELLGAVMSDLLNYSIYPYR